MHSEQNGGGSLVDVGRLAYTREATEEREAGRTRARYCKIEGTPQSSARKTNHTSMVFEKVILGTREIALSLNSLHMLVASLGRQRHTTLLA